MALIIFVMFALAGLIVTVSVLVSRRRQRVASRKTLDSTLAACRALLALVANFQQHRGMSSALLSGDLSFRGRMDDKAREIAGLIPSLRQVAVQESGRAHPCLTPSDLALFQFNWDALREKLTGLSVEQSIAQHTLLIDQLLQWLSALGESRVELLSGNSCERGLARNYASRLPALTECLGQARALGASVAARRGCSAVARVRLIFLVARAEALLNQANEVGAQGASAAKAEMAVRQMARVIRTRMLLSSGISVAAPEFFEIATAAVDGVFTWIGECGTELMSAGKADSAGRPSWKLQHG